MIRLLYYLLAIESARAYGKYKANFPNAEGIMGIKALGHDDINGGGALNVFGHDFAKYGYSWSQNFCQLDSDSDGFTNGQELGDPCCEWSPTSPSTLIVNGISHPGDPSSTPTNPILLTRCQKIVTRSALMTTSQNDRVSSTTTDPLYVTQPVVSSQFTSAPIANTPITQTPITQTPITQTPYSLTNTNQLYPNQPVVTPTVVNQDYANQAYTNQQYNQPFTSQPLVNPSTANPAVANPSIIYQDYTYQDNANLQTPTSQSGNLPNSNSQYANTPISNSQNGNPTLVSQPVIDQGSHNQPLVNQPYVNQTFDRRVNSSNSTPTPTPSTGNSITRSMETLWTVFFISICTVSCITFI